MISRRNFFKIAGLSTVAIGAGFTTGKLAGNSKSLNYILHGFIPADESIINNLVAVFKSKVKSNVEAVVMADSKVGEIVNRVDLKNRQDNFSSKGSITTTKSPSAFSSPAHDAVSISTSLVNA